MKATKVLCLFLFVTALNVSCSSQSNEPKEEEAISQAGNVEVYYFHNARRCATCQAVEAESEKAVKELYGDKVSFQAYNLEEKTGEEKADELGVAGQTLLIVKGDEKINITNEAFMHARNNPEKLKQIIKEKMDPLVN